MKSCIARVITDRFENHNFKEYSVISEDNRLELMMPYNNEKGLRMNIDGPPRCGKSHLIGQTLREYVRHHQDRPIYLFSQVAHERAIDGVMEDVGNHLRCDLNLFIRVDLDKLLETDLTIEQIRGETGAFTIFDDIDKIPNKDLLARIDKIKDEVLATGRDHQYTGADIDLNGAISL